MAAFLKDTTFRQLAKTRGVKRMFKSSRQIVAADLRAYTILIDLLAKSAAASQGRKIVQPKHVEMAVKTLEGFNH